MAHSLSAKKRIRQNVKQNSRNRRRKQQIKDAIREFEDALHAHKTENAAELLKTVYKHLDRTAARGTIHKNTVARKKARLAKRLAEAAK
ncbi:MAG: 30S ribosomal protein S20 [Phycisphaerae bacterium]|nr:30S ribosomal protein S20 [Phycisphaerae bacterium]